MSDEPVDRATHSNAGVAEPLPAAMPLPDVMPVPDVPRVGWVDAPSRVHTLEGIAPALWVKRDDEFTALRGCTKVRKFDVLFARDEYARAERWISIGAIGSGHVRALSMAGKELGVPVTAHLFDEEISEGVLDNLAWTATNADKLTFVGSRPALFLRHPGAVLAISGGRRLVIPAGATTAWGTVGVALGVLELAGQVAAGEMPKPSRIVVPYGSGGTAAGLLLGLGIVGWTDVELDAVRVVERPFTPLRRVHALARDAWRVWCGKRTMPQLPPCRVRDGFLGRAYGRPTAASLAAVERLRASDVALEPVYTGKAMAAVLADVDNGTLPDDPAAPVLFWHTRRGPLPEAPDGWEARLPRALRRRLSPDYGRFRGRRRILLGAGAAGAAAVVGGRSVGYDGVAGDMLTESQVSVLSAAAEALLGDVATPVPSAAQVAANVDRFLVGMPESTLGQLDLLFVALEQIPLRYGHLSRFTRLDVSARLSVLTSLRAEPAPARDLYRGVRDLVLLGAYQDPVMWPALGYEGPMVPRSEGLVSRGRDTRPRPPSRYDHLLAAAGAVPPTEEGA